MPNLRKYIQQQEILVIAIGIVLGFALKDLVESFIRSFVTPVLDKLYGGAGSLTSKAVDIGGIRFKPGDFADATIIFLAVVLVAYVAVYTYNKATHQLRPKEESKSKK
jgi:large conductance mechanosensitive channel